MALRQLEAKYIQSDHEFYRKYLHYFLLGMMACILIFLLVVSRVFVQILNRPLPGFTAVQAINLNESMPLVPFEDPNLLPDTLIRFASKAASTAYTFDFVNYDSEISAVRSYFTDAGWIDFNSAISNAISTVVKDQLFVTGVVSGTPVISNQGVLPGRGYVWRVQIPFLVTYQSANNTTVSSYLVTLAIIRVPTSTNPQGIGIDQFVMVSA